MKQLAPLVLSLAAACGRAGFDQVSAPDAAAPDATAPAQLSCDGARFPTSTSTTAIAATSTDAGYFVLAVDNAGAVTGAAFTFPTTGSALAQSSQAVAITSNATAAAAGVGLPEGVLAEVPYGRPDTTGTALIPLNADLSPRGAPITHDGWIAGGGMLARTQTGPIVLLGQNKQSKNIEAQLVTSDGAFSGKPTTLVSGSTNPYSATITAAGDHFLATWVASGTTDAEARAQLFDNQLVPVSTATKVSADPVNGAEFPRAAYAAGADRYLFAWYQKVNGGMDQVWVSLRDGNLAPLGDPMLLATQGTLPVIAASNDSFLVVWQAGAKLAAARISKDGAITALGVTNTGGNSSGWDVVARDGQPTLVWVESGGTGPNLWLNPLCN